MESQVKIYNSRPTEGDEIQMAAETAVDDFWDGIGHLVTARPARKGRSGNGHTFTWGNLPTETE